MFETLFTRPGVLRRHREGPLAAERASYLKGLAAQGMARATILRRASYCLYVAGEIQRWTPDRCFDEEQVTSLTAAWATSQLASGRASSTKWVGPHFRFAASDFLRSLGRMYSPPMSMVDGYEYELADFVATQQQDRWTSEATCRSARWQVGKLLDYLRQRDVRLANVAPRDVDAYFEQAGQRWNRSSLRTCAKVLRAWFAHCEKRRWVHAGLASTILLPRMYHDEGLPIGPTWEEVGRILSSTVADDAMSLRNHAIILLLSVYGLRSGEVRRLLLEDIDWTRDRIRIVRSKSGREQTLPLEPRVGNAIARYLRQGRPRARTRAVFVTLRGPHRALSAGGLYNVVKRHLSKVSSAKQGRGPHALRHACARHLLDVGRTFKEVGDHLGHRSPDATSHYAKVNLASLRRVALDDLGGLA